VIHARIAGVVGNRTARVGQYVRPGLQLLTIVPRQPYITANFKETQLTNVRVGQSTSIAIDAYPDIKLEGHVESFAPATGAQFSVLPPENASGNFTKIVQRVPVRIAIHDPGPWLDRLRPGLSVVVSVPTRSPAAAVASEMPAELPTNPIAR
jgi:membrane fusion protein, multidrug efflux system